MTEYPRAPKGYRWKMVRPGRTQNFWSVDLLKRRWFGLFTYAHGIKLSRPNDAEDVAESMRWLLKDYFSGKDSIEARTVAVEVNSLGK